MSFALIVKLYSGRFPTWVNSIIFDSLKQRMRFVCMRSLSFILASLFSAVQFRENGQKSKDFIPI
jgi:hypothetical protein